MSITPVAVGTLYVHCPDELQLVIGPQVDLLYPGACYSVFSSEGETIFGLSNVPHPVGQTRYTLVNLYHWSAALGRPVYWSWVPPAGAVVLPGGTLGLNCREGAESVVVKAALQSWFPLAYLYTFRGDDGWVLYQVDVPRLGEDFYARYVQLLAQVSSVSFHWHSWFDRVEMPDGSLASVYHPEV